MANKTPLYDRHRALGGKLVDFGGWDMPLHYGSQLKEHQVVRDSCGMFDVSHMRVVDVSGSGTEAFLRYLLANDVSRIPPGKALYSVMLNPEGGIIDDLIVYFLTPSSYRVVVNCATGEGDIAWMQAHVGSFDATVTPRPDLGIVAIQGPEAIEKVSAVICDDARAAVAQMPVFGCAQVGRWTLARTGYTGEDGLEIILPAEQCADLWQRLLDIDVAPIGLAARDTLRLEAGLNLYGNEMNDRVSPLEANLEWTVAWEPESRDFIGRKALEAARDGGVEKKLVGLVMRGRGVLRAHQPVYCQGATEPGEITSGTFSPTLNCSIAMALVPVSAETSAEVEIRGRRVEVDVVKPCFVRRGKVLV